MSGRNDSPGAVADAYERWAGFIKPPRQRDEDDARDDMLDREEREEG